MEFSYKLSGRGWAEGHIKINSQVVYFTASYQLNCLLAILPDCVAFPQKSKTFEWYEEPGGTVWTLERNDEEVSIKIVSYEDMYSKKEIGIVFNEVCLMDDFVIAVVNELNMLLKQHGIGGYKESWVNHEFPYNEYLKLKEFIKRKL
jgi:hypothetical protein